MPIYSRSADMNPQFVPMTLGDIFEKTVSLIGRTFLRNLLIAFVFLSIPLMLMAIAATDFYSSIGDIQRNIAEAEQEGVFDEVLSLMGSLTFFIFTTFVFGLGAFLAEIAASIIVSMEMRSKPFTWWDAVVDTFHQKWLRGIGQAILKMLIFGGAMVVIGITLAIVTAVSGGLGGILMIVFFLAAIPAFLYFAFKWYFSLTAIAVDDLEVIESMRQSWQLVEGQWWRTFGIILLLSILAQFIISIVSLPITFGSMWSVYKDFFSMLRQTGGNITPEQLAALENSFGPGVAVGSAVSGVLTLLMAPVYTVVLYYDLRARKVSPKAAPAAGAAEVPQEPIDFDKL
jgi:hypothetical protein